MKIVKICTMIALITFMTACNNDSLDNENINEVDNSTEIVETIKETDEMIQNDKTLLTKVYAALGEFINNTSTELSSYLSQGNVTLAKAYAIGVTENDDREEIEETFTTLKERTQTKDGTLIAKDIENLYLQYMVILDSIADGKIDEETNELIKKTTTDIDAITESIMLYN